ncbi:CLUMA_CG007861, isoform A [Clunio marinus]|uniref:CLUMA_CG007861, isoform A n=1 Tax=Clunio marinus TaxID=568069 RepID=A0A1J1I3K3_9DIPT|nr:CLUMA_CG007861, isoform A [Clunio marinus]
MFFFLSYDAIRTSKTVVSNLSTLKAAHYGNHVSPLKPQTMSFIYVELFCLWWGWKQKLIEKKVTNFL